MITLNSERGLVRVENWDDVVGLPGFTDGVDYRARKLEAIIGRYVFPDRIPCGLGSCRKKHNRGFVIAIQGGAVTNIGKDCGKTHFGVDFVTLSRAFERDDRNRERRERLAAFQSQIPGLNQRIDDLRLRQRGDWIFKTARTFRSSECPAPIRERLSAMIQARDGRLMLERLETQAELAARIAMIERPRGVADETEHKDPPRKFVSDQVGLVEGLGIFYPELDVRELLIRDVLPRLKIMEALVVTDLSDLQLRDHVKWVNGSDEKLAKAGRAIEEGMRFLRPQNLAPFRLILQSAGDLKTFARLLEQLK